MFSSISLRFSSNIFLLYTTALSLCFTVCNSSILCVGYHTSFLATVPNILGCVCHTTALLRSPGMVIFDNNSISRRLSMAWKSVGSQGSSRDDRVRNVILSAAVLPAGLLLLQLSLGQLSRVQELPWMAPAVWLPHGRSPLSVRYDHVWSRFGRLHAERATAGWWRRDCYRGWWRRHQVPSALLR
jgi:hypothetical protein